MMKERIFREDFVLIVIFVFENLGTDSRWSWTFLNFLTAAEWGYHLPLLL